MFKSDHLRVSSSCSQVIFFMYHLYVHKRSSSCSQAIFFVYHFHVHKRSSSCSQAIIFVYHFHVHKRSSSCIIFMFTSDLLHVHKRSSSCSQAIFFMFTSDLLHVSSSCSQTIIFMFTNDHLHVHKRSSLCWFAVRLIHILRTSDRYLPSEKIIFILVCGVSRSGNELRANARSFLHKRSCWMRTRQFGSFSPVSWLLGSLGECEGRFSKGTEHSKGQLKLKSLPSQAVFFRVACNESRASKLETVKTFCGLDAMASSSVRSRLLPTPTAKTFRLDLCSSAACWRVLCLLFDLPSVTTIRMLAIRSRSPCAWSHTVSKFEDGSALIDLLVNRAKFWENCSTVGYTFRKL